MLKEMGDGNKIGFLATVDEQGKPHLRPLVCLLIGGKIYFSTVIGTRKTKEIAMNPWVEIVIPFIEDENLTYIRFSGEAFRIFEESAADEIIQQSGYHLDTFIKVPKNEPVVLYEMFPTHIEKLDAKEKRLINVTDDFLAEDK